MTTNKVYFPNLDALRFFAFLTVFIAHCVLHLNYKFPTRISELISLHFFTNGDLGVRFFFVLSGFLISWLLFEEKSQKHTINIKSFYARRVLRIWPVYYLVVIIGFISAFYIDWTFLGNPNFEQKVNIGDLPWYVFLLGNVPLVQGFSGSMILGVLWSVAIEEQFYLFWPWLFSFFTSKIIKYSCYFIILTYFILCFFYHFSYFSTISALPCLAIGSLGAYYSAFSHKFVQYFKGLNKSTILIVYALLFIYVPIHGLSHIFGPDIFDLYYPFEVPLFSFLFLFIILEQNFSDNSFFKFGKLKHISNLGKISYGLYAYHVITFPIAHYFINYLLPFSSTTFIGYILQSIIAFFLTIAIAKISYKYMESFFLKFKRKYA